MIQMIRRETEATTTWLSQHRRTMKCSTYRKHDYTQALLEWRVVSRVERLSDKRSRVTTGYVSSGNALGECVLRTIATNRLLSILRRKVDRMGHTALIRREPSTTSTRVKRELRKMMVEREKENVESEFKPRFRSTINTTWYDDDCLGQVSADSQNDMHWSVFTS